MQLQVASTVTAFFRFVSRWVTIFVVALISTAYLIMFLSWAISPVIGLLFIFFWPAWILVVSGMMALLAVIHMRHRNTRPSTKNIPSAKVPYYFDESR